MHRTQYPCLYCLQNLTLFGIPNQLHFQVAFFLYRWLYFRVSKTVIPLVIMPRCMCASKITCLCLYLYAAIQLLKDQRNASSSHVFLDLQNNAWFSELCLDTWNAIAAFSEDCIEKLVHGVLATEASAPRCFHSS